MLTRLAVSNFKCLREVAFNLHPFNVFIGPNDSGKTSVFEALQTHYSIQLSGMAKTVKDHGKDLLDLVWMRDLHRLIAWDFEGQAVDGRPFSYHLAIEPLPVGMSHGRVFEERLTVDGAERLQCFQGNEGRWDGRVFGIPTDTPGLSLLASNFDRKNQDSHFREAVSPTSAVAATMSVAYYRLNPEMLSRPSPLLIEGRALRYDGYGLPALIDHMLSSERERFLELERTLSQHIPAISGIIPEPVSFTENGEQREGKQLRFRLKNSKVTIPASQASDGVLLLLAYLTIVSQEYAPSILCFEEPENGFHYSRLQFVVGLLREVSRGVMGARPRQIFLSTHNPLLLNHVEPEEVYVFKRDIDAGTIVTPMTETKDFDERIQDFDLGELWYNVGEEELLRPQA